jgi:hypothetical protein
MNPRFMSRLVSVLARIIGFERGREEPIFQTGDNDPISLAHFAPSAEMLASTYVIAATRNPEEWTVYNSPLSRNVAAGLKRNQAATLAQVLNLACPHRPNAQTNKKTHRKGLRGI